MRSKLERIASGKIEYAKIPLKLSTVEISLTVGPGGRAGGSFSISSDRVIKGVIYSSSTRMCLENHGFQARITRVNYIFDAAGLWGGEEIEGSFCIICEAGERIVPFKVKVGEHVYPAEDYTYFVTADPIEPDTRGSQAAKIDTSVMLTGGAADPE